MGKTFSAFKKETDVEKLNRLVEEIRVLEDHYLVLEHKKQCWMEGLVTYGTAFYFVIGGLIYLFYFPQDKASRKAYTICYALYPIILLLFKEFLGWCYSSQMEKMASKLTKIKSEKRQVMDTIITMEPFKTFRTCLEKSSDDRQAFNSLTGKSVSNVSFDVKKRFSSSKEVPSRSTGVLHQPSSKSVVHKLLEFLAGDSINNRYALICVHCGTHNGMALEEEYEYIGYKCCFCNYFNPPKKVRPSPPKLLLNRYPLQTLKKNEDLDTETSSEEDNKFGKIILKPPVNFQTSTFD